MPNLKTVGIGNLAEEAACNYLKARGFKILERNWKNRFCEIDIVAEKGKRIYFVEVKYRKSSNWGEGLEYITRTKLKQMRFAAQMWVQENRFDGDYSISAIEVMGERFKVTNFIEDCA